MMKRNTTLFLGPRIWPRIWSRLNGSTPTLFVPPVSPAVEMISTSCADFRGLKTGNFKLVDKTQPIYENILSPSSQKYNFIVRPRRFGKSLMCSTVKEAYGGEGAKALFSDTWLGSAGKWDFAERSRSVIHLDMSIVAGEDNDVKTFNADLVAELKDIAIRFGIILSTSSPRSCFKKLISEMYFKHDRRVVVIIDEYDKPLLDLMHEPERMESIREALHTFYVILKAMDDMLEKVVMTGLYNFAQTFIFSSLNNLNDLTFLHRTGTMLGFTRTEIRDTYPGLLERMRVKKKMSTVDEVLDALALKYNGYRFGVNQDELSESVFNPFGVCNALAKLDLLHDYWSASGSAQLLLTALPQPFDPDAPITEDMEALLLSYSPNIITSPNSLLLYGGYFSFHRVFMDNAQLKVEMKIVNQSVAEGLRRLFIRSMFDNKASSSTIDLTCSAVQRHFNKNAKCLDGVELANDLNVLFGHVSDSIVHDETKGGAACRVVVDMIIRQGLGKTYVYSAESHTIIGQLDASIEGPESILIVEYKYDKTASDAIYSILSREYPTQFQNQPKPIILLGLNFDSKSRKWTAVVEEYRYDENTRKWEAPSSKRVDN